MTWTQYKSPGTNIKTWSYIVEDDKAADQLPVPSNIPEGNKNVGDKVYFFGHGNAASGQIESLVVFGSNIGRQIFTVNSSDVNAAYTGIITRQCQRAQDFISNELRKLEWDDEDTNERVVDTIAAAIDLVGEPGIYAACQELMAHQNHQLIFEKLLMAVSSAKDRSTDRHRVNLLSTFLHSSDAVARYSAVEALGNMASHSNGAKTALQKVAASETDHNIAHVASIYGR